MPVRDLRKIEEYIDRLRIKDRDSEDFKIFSSVLDTSVLKTLYRLSNKKIITAMGGVVSTGKEAHVFHAVGERGDVAVKIYRIETSEFHRMEDYIIGDPRFTRTKFTKRQLVYTWTRKEFKNLERAFKGGVSVPEPISYANNVLVMKFIGEDGVPAPTLKDISGELPGITDPEELFNELITQMERLYRIRLVHADLSEYNVLWFERPFIIDMGQAVHTEHPHSMSFLKRDVVNLIRFFSRYGVRADVEEVIERVVK